MAEARDAEVVIERPDGSRVTVVVNILRVNPATAHIPVVALSANAIPRDIEKGLVAGFFRYLTKPIKVNEFMSTLDVALRFAETAAGRADKQANA
jgi:CheY-like chemotaxis protein